MFDICLINKVGHSELISTNNFYGERHLNPLSEEHLNPLLFHHLGRTIEGTDFSRQGIEIVKTAIVRIGWHVGHWCHVVQAPGCQD